MAPPLSALMMMMSFLFSKFLSAVSSCLLRLFFSFCLDVLVSFFIWFWNDSINVLTVWCGLGGVHFCSGFGLNRIDSSFLSTGVLFLK